MLENVGSHSRQDFIRLVNRLFADRLSGQKAERSRKCLLVSKVQTSFLMCQGKRGVCEESPGFTKTRCWVTPSGGDPRESAAESKPPLCAAMRRRVRVKGCGKSTPRTWQHVWQGKPHLKQSRVGMHVFYAVAGACIRAFLNV